MVKAIEHANDAGWHIGDEEARLQYLACVVSSMADKVQREEAIMELADRYKRGLLYISYSLQTIDACA